MPSWEYTKARAQVGLVWLVNITLMGHELASRNPRRQSRRRISSGSCGLGLPHPGGEQVDEVIREPDELFLALGQSIKRERFYPFRHFC